MKVSDPIASIMTKQLVTVSKADDLREVKRLMAKHKIRHVPVIDAGKLVGMISKTDLNRLSMDEMLDDQETADAALFEMLSIDQVMASNLVSIAANNTLEEAAAILGKNEFHALPVVDGQNIVGIVTSTDIIRELLAIAKTN
ncbi:MAG: CBS domain-containing protein [Schleiferiaceae bacterium]|nr:CBS domain-containing protein [Schleiferiaceae bacterium]